MTAVLSLGSNLGDRIGHLRRGLEVLDQHAFVRAVSPVYETASVGFGDAPPYLNLVALIDSDDPERTLVAAHAAEQSQGRLRSRRWGPRTLDVDVISVGSTTSTDPRLTLPHPRAHQRAFVLIPWLDLDPDAWLPGRGAARDLLGSLPDQGVVRAAESMSLPR